MNAPLLINQLISQPFHPVIKHKSLPKEPSSQLRPSHHKAARSLVNTLTSTCKVESKQHRNDSEKLHQRMPKDEEVKSVTESQAQDAMVAVQQRIRTLTQGANGNDQHANHIEKASNDFWNKSYLFVTVQIRQFSLLAAKAFLKGYHSNGSAIRKLFEAQLEASQKKHDEERKKIEEQKALAHKSGISWEIINGLGGLSGFIYGCAILSGPMGIGIAAMWMVAGIAAMTAAGCEYKATAARESGNESAAQAWGQVAKIALYLEVACGLLTFGLQLQLALFAKAGRIGAVEAGQKISAEVLANFPEPVGECIQMGGAGGRALSEAAAKKAEKAMRDTWLKDVARFTQRRLRTMGHEIPLKSIEAMPEAAWKNYAGIKALVLRNIISQSKTFNALRVLSAVAPGINKFNEAVLNVQIQKCEYAIKAAMEEARLLQRIAQDVTHKMLEDTLEWAKRSLQRLTELLKAAQSWLEKLCQTLLVASNAIPVAA